MAVTLAAQIAPVQTVKVTCDATAGKATAVTLPAWCRAIFVRFFDSDDELTAGSIASTGTDNTAQSTDKLGCKVGEGVFYPVSPSTQFARGTAPIVYLACNVASGYAEVVLVQYPSMAVALIGTPSQGVNAELDDIAVVDTNSAPADVTDGVAVPGNPRILHLLCSTATSGADGPVKFKIWHWFGSSWALDRSFAADGVILDLTLATVEALLLSIEAPGTRVAIEVITSSAILTLTITPVTVS